MANVYKSSEFTFSAGGVYTLITAPASSIVNSILVSGYTSGVVTFQIEKVGGSSRTILKVSSDGEQTSGPLVLEVGDKLHVTGVAGITAVASYVYSATIPDDLSIDALTDVNITGINNGDILVYDSALGYFQPTANTGGSGGSTTLAGLTDTSIISVSADDIIRYNGSVWQNEKLYGSDITLNSGTATTVTGKLSSLETDLTNAAGLITTNSGNISSLTTRVDDAELDITNLQTNLNNTIAAVSSNDADIAANAVAISTNASDILNAATLIGTNTAAISTNSGAIAVNAADIVTVENLLATHQATLAAHNDVSVTGISSGDVLSWNGSQWQPLTIDVNGVAGAVDIVSTDNDLLTVSVSGQEVQLNPILPRTMLEDVKNVSGGALTKGMAVHVTGSTGNEAEVVKADAASGLAAHLILHEDLPNNLDTGKAVAIGFINNVSVPDTTNFQPGTEVYLGNAGAFTHVKPTGTSIVQYLGIVLNASSTSGAGTISGIIQNLGVENQLPNLADGYVWIGDSNGVPQQVDSSTLGGGGGGSTTINNNSNNRIITGSDTANTLEAEAKLTYDGTNVDVIGAGVTDGLRITGGNVSGVAPSIGLTTGGNFNRIDVKADLVLQNQTKIAFDTDPINTYIAADTQNPENLNFYADSSLGFYPDDSLDVYSTAIGANKVFTIASGVNSARVGIGMGATTGARELYVNGGIMCQEDFFDYADTQSALTWKGETINLGSAVSTTAGRLYYYTGTTWALADADVLAAASSLLAIATATSSNKGMLVNGWYTIQGGATNGQLYMSPSEGLFTNTQPSTSGQYVRVVGHGLGGGLIRFNPSNDFYEVN